MTLDEFEVKPDKFKHAENRKRKRNLAAKALREKGAFAMRVEDSRKTTYKRERFKAREVEPLISDGELYGT